MTAFRMFACASLALGLACATASAPEPSATLQPTQQYEVISRAEMDAPTVGDIDILTLVQRVRPKWLSYRGPSSARDPDSGLLHFSVDGGQLQTLDALRSIHVSEISEIRFLSTSAAAQRFGTPSKAGPVIVLKRR